MINSQLAEQILLEEMTGKARDIEGEMRVFDSQKKGMVELNCNFSNLVSYLHNVNNQIYNQQMEINQIKF